MSKQKKMKTHKNDKKPKEVARGNVKKHHQRLRERKKIWTKTLKSMWKDRQFCKTHRQTKSSMKLCAKEIPNEKKINGNE